MGQCMGLRLQTGEVTSVTSVVSAGVVSRPSSRLITSFPGPTAPRINPPKHHRSKGSNGSSNSSNPSNAHASKGSSDYGSHKSRALGSMDKHMSQSLGRAPSGPGSPLPGLALRRITHADVAPRIDMVKTNTLVTFDESVQIATARLAAPSASSNPKSESSADEQGASGSKTKRPQTPGQHQPRQGQAKKIDGDLGSERRGPVSFMDTKHSAYAVSRVDTKYAADAALAVECGGHFGKPVDAAAAKRTFGVPETPFGNDVGSFGNEVGSFGNDVGSFGKRPETSLGLSCESTVDIQVPLHASPLDEPKAFPRKASPRKASPRKAAHACVPVFLVDDDDDQDSDTTPAEDESRGIDDEDGNVRDVNASPTMGIFVINAPSAPSSDGVTTCDNDTFEKSSFTTISAPGANRSNTLRLSSLVCNLDSASTSSKTTMAAAVTPTSVFGLSTCRRPQTATPRSARSDVSWSLMSADTARAKIRPRGGAAASNGAASHGGLLTARSDTSDVSIPESSSQIQILSCSYTPHISCSYTPHTQGRAPLSARSDGSSNETCSNDGFLSPPSPAASKFANLPPSSATPMTNPSASTSAPQPLH
jgi:hypothetical protein